MKIFLAALLIFLLLSSCSAFKSSQIITVDSSDQSDKFTMTSSSDALVIRDNLKSNKRSRNFVVYLDGQKIPWESVTVFDPKKIKSINVDRAKDNQKGVIRINSKP